MIANRAAAFPAVYALLRVAADVADHWVIAAPTVSASARVSGVGVAR